MTRKVNQASNKERHSWQCIEIIDFLSQSCMINSSYLVNSNKQGESQTRLINHTTIITRIYLITSSPTLEEGIILSSMRESLIRLANLNPKVLINLLIKLAKDQRQWKQYQLTTLDHQHKLGFHDSRLPNYSFQAKNAQNLL